MPVTSSIWFKLLVVSTGLLSVGSSFLVLEIYESRPSAQGATVDWPTGTGLKLSPTNGTLLVFAHPQCPCTRATLNELDRFASANLGKLAIDVLFYSPASEPRSWVESDSWHHSLPIPGVQTIRDEDGRQARRFHAESSGLVLLYSPKGTELFRGGLTSTRGHEGESAGLDSLKSFIETGKVSVRRTPVYGCSIFG